ncbi:MAG: hypothetical protein V1742_09430, partial [Pseudomonadota bacterium]
NIFKRVSAAFEGGLRSSQYWHSDLIESMSKPRPNRPALLSGSLRETLEEYLDFRHFFRHAYSFDLNWEKMRHLVLGIEKALLILDNELDVFFKTLED